jgi:hypothetical protein
MRGIDRSGELIINPPRLVLRISQGGPRAVSGQQSRRRGPADCLSSLEYNQMIFVVIFAPLDDNGRFGKIETGVFFPARASAGTDPVSLVDDRAGQKLSLLNVGHVRS